MGSPDLGKRKYKRIKHRFTARIRLYQKEVKPNESLKWDIVTIRDLSAGGVSFNYDKKIPLGTSLEFNIALPFIKEPAHCVAEVCRIDESQSNKIGLKKTRIYWIAVRFIEIESDKKEAIIKFADYFPSP